MDPYSTAVAGIIPALAGNTAYRDTRPPRCRDHPRSRGEYRLLRQLSLMVYGSSPLSRGIRNQGHDSQRWRRIIPALAGNTVLHDPMMYRLRDHPRSRGEYTDEDKALMKPEGSSPLSRGIQSVAEAIDEMLGIIPALAGNTQAERRSAGSCGDHPRSRGEYGCRFLSASSSWGSSPLSRGIPRRFT